MRTNGTIAVITGAADMYFVYKTVRAAEHTHWLASTVTVATVVPLLISAISVALPLAGWGQLRASFDALGTTPLLVAAVARRLGVWFAAVLVATVLYLLFGSRLHDDLPDVRFRAVGWLGTMLVGAILGVVLWARAGLCGPRCRSPATASSSTTPCHDLTCRGTRSMTSPMFSHKPRASGSSSLRGDGATEVIGNAALYAPGGVALYWMIRHYWLHPARTG